MYTSYKAKTVPEMTYNVFSGTLNPTHFTSLQNWLPWQRPSTPLDLQLTHDSYGPSEPKVISIGSAVFAQGTADCPYTLQWDAPFPLKIAPSHGGSGPPSNT